MKRSLPFLVSGLVVALDQITKYLVRGSLTPFETVRILPFLQFVSVRNEGAAFGLFKGLGNNTFIIISAAAIILLSVLLAKSRGDWVAYALILGGAIGNLIDRIVFGRVTDFIDVFVGRFHWPAFNIADSALTIGLGLLLVSSLLPARTREPV